MTSLNLEKQKKNATIERMGGTKWRRVEERPLGLVCDWILSFSVNTGKDRE